MKRRFLLTALIVLSVFVIKAQSDTAFWFAVPDVSAAFNYDRPVFIRVTSHQNPCVVTISQPANPAFPVQILNLAPNSTQSVNLTTWIDLLECAPGNVIQKKGLRIVSTNTISAYYEVNANGPNPEIFSLKGKNALGNQFYISSQYLLANTASHSPTPTSSFNIVASEDNTGVTITPSNNIVGHAANIPFTITLNRGETYAAIASGPGATEHLQGSFVASTKPVAITLSDDLLKGTAYGGICEDLAGDQAVPVNITGTEYIAFRTSLNSPFDKLYITATQNGTTVTQDGVLISTLNAGQSAQLSISTATTFIQTSLPAYAFQLAGVGCEVGGAVLPKLNCTGSRSVSVVRSSIENCIITLLVKNGGQGNFRINNVPGSVNGASFTAVPGTGGQWYAAKISLPLGSYPNNSVITVSNSTHIFQMGFLEGGVNSGTGFGYFSDFNTLQANAYPPLQAVCTGNSIILYADTVLSATYSWTGPNLFASSQQQVSIGNATPVNSGNYILSVSVPGCGTYNDTVVVNINEPVRFTDNQNRCDGQSYMGYVSTGSYIDTFVASNGCDSIRTLNLTINPNTFSTINQSICEGQSYMGYTVAGTYIDTLTSSSGCDSIRTLNLTIKQRSSTNLNQTICEGQSYMGYAASGTYIDTIAASNGCDSIITLTLTVKTRSFFTVGKTICEGQIFEGYSITGNYRDTFTAANGCDSVRTLNLVVIPRVSPAITITICDGQTYNGYTVSGTYIDTFVSVAGCDSIRTLNLIVAAKKFTSINNSICEGTVYLGYAQTGVYVDTFISSGGCDSIRTLNLSVTPKVTLIIDRTICEGQNYEGYTASGTFTDTFPASNGCDSIRTLRLMVTGSIFSSENKSICTGQAYLGYTNSGIYIDTFVAFGGCDSIRTLNLVVQNIPRPQLQQDIVLCAPDSFKLFPGVFDSYLWQDGSLFNEYTVRNTGLYSVVVSNSCGSASANTIVTVNNCGIYFPNAFSPDGNGKNDVFNILNALDISDYYLAVYNRWGELVFETADINTGWNGFYKGKPADTGTYVWHCRLKKQNGFRNIKGTVVLLR